MITYKQGYIALITLTLVITLTMSIMHFVDYAFMETWLVLAFIMCVPFQVASGILLETNKPRLLARLSLPSKGLLIILCCAVSAILVSIVTYYTVGGGIELPKPPVINYAIAVVVATFWYAIVWQCWPIAKFTNKPEWLALSVVFVGLFLGYLIFNFSFSFEFMQSSPLYEETLDPKGWFKSWNVVAFLVTTVAVIFTFVLFDFWPISQIKLGNKAFVGNLIKSLSIIAIAGSIYLLFVNYWDFDPVIYLVNGPISYIFGMFVPLNLFSGQLFSHIKQPTRGIYLVIVSAIAGFLLNLLYFWFAQQMLPEALIGGLYQQELWVANAMLAFSFPLLVAITAHLQFWPLCLINFKTKNNSPTTQKVMSN
ncbi:hypothetical protein [Algibacillus agarilyticus]|uniref:hypothetical protein n=1 Tax=Algibacillus agarilyticus TaxID=2234133 RepID=UPI000DD0CF67|nr:hypothetical protein [Algibacillus agarilyticus]